MLWDSLLHSVLPDRVDMLPIDDRETVCELWSQILNGTRLGPRNQDNDACVDFEHDYAHCTHRHLIIIIQYIKHVLPFRHNLAFSSCSEVQNSLWHKLHLWAIPMIALWTAQQPRLFCPEIDKKILCDIDAVSQLPWLPFYSGYTPLVQNR